MRMMCLAMALTLAPPCHAGWMEVGALTRTASGASFLDGDFLEDGLHGWVAGYGTEGRPARTVVFRTTDGGESWEELETGFATANVGALDFVDAEHGWLIADHAIHRTDDGGRTWAPEACDGFEWERGALAEDLCMVRLDCGWACGRAGTSQGIFTYDSETRTWETETAFGGRLTTIWARGPRDMWAAGEGPEDRPYDGARRSHELTTRRMIFGSPVADIFFVDHRRGWAACDLGRIFHSSDRGAGWSEKQTPTLEPFTAIHFTSRDEGLAVTRSGNVYATHDGGDTWEADGRVNGWSREILFDGTDQLVLTTSKLFRHWEPARIAPIPRLRRAEETITDAGGETRAAPTLLWSASATLARVHGGEILTAAFFHPDGRNAWVTGWDGTRAFLYSTGDGAGTWQRRELPAGMQEVRAIEFLDAESGYIGCDGPNCISYTDDGGASWTPQRPGWGSWTDDDRVVDIDMHRVGHGYATLSSADHGRLLMLDADSTRWEHTGHDFEGQSAALFIRNMKCLWAGARADDGVRCTPLRGFERMALPERGQLEDLFFHSESLGWAALGRTILFTPDGGSTWDVQTGREVHGYVRAVAFADAAHGCAGTSAGQVLNTWDGGHRWYEALNVRDEFIDVHLFGDHWYATALGALYTTRPRRLVLGPLSRLGPPPEPELLWAGGEEFAGDGVRPDRGRRNHQAEFRVRYRHPGNIPPEWIRVSITTPGVPGSSVMSLRPVPGARGEYRDGVAYGLGFTPHRAGEFQYRFLARVEGGAVASGEPTSDHTWIVEDVP
ncbi:MAG: WD40/YVTN/BNR-like repeat-containing protein [Armatimonadota bacterium]